MSSLTPDPMAPATEQKTHKSLTMKKVDGKPGQVYYPLQILSTPTPTPTPSQILLRPTHLALNHRDLFLRQHLYPSPSFTTPLLSDACCVPVSPSPSPTQSNQPRFLLPPCTGWLSSPSAPESPFSILGGTSTNPLGLAQSLILVDKSLPVPCPAHLSGPEAAALPLAGLTAWRALVTKSGAAERGKRILITGIGGGVALMVLQFAVAMGVGVWVSSSSKEKLSRAQELGARGGVNYRENESWEKELLGQVKADDGGTGFDAIIDGAGGPDIGPKATKLLVPGGVLVVYGMTVEPKISFSMAGVLKNIEVRGTTMGSLREFRDMVAFVGEKGVRPVVSRVVRGGIGEVEKWEELWGEMKGGRQMGKLVFEVMEEDGEDGGEVAGGSKL